jgi:hypothetical protein
MMTFSRNLATRNTQERFTVNLHHETLDKLYNMLAGKTLMDFTIYNKEH